MAQSSLLPASKRPAAGGPHRAGPSPSPFPALPAELQWRVLGFLPVRSLAVVGTVSQAYRRLANDNVLWKELAILPHQKWLQWRNADMTWKRHVEAEHGLPTRMLPLSRDTHSHVLVAPDGLAVTCVKSRLESNTAIRGDRSIKIKSSLSPYLFYFEVHVARLQKGGCASVGFASRDYPRDSQVGWHLFSCGWHNDDGCVFLNQNRSRIFTLGRWGNGDTIGCGVVQGYLFFTRNGRAERRLFPVRSRAFGWRSMFPCLGVDRADLELNFGQKPFAYDLAELQSIWSIVPLEDVRELSDDSDWDSDDDEMFYAKDGAPTPFWASDSDEEAEEEEDGEEDEEDEDEDEEDDVEADGVPSLLGGSEGSTESELPSTGTEDSVGEESESGHARNRRPSPVACAPLLWFKCQHRLPVAECVQPW
eukprot:EG_transcript_14168